MLVLERGGRLTRRIWSQRLEGSRFIRWQLYRLAAGGSRERPKARQFYRTSYPCRTEQTRWANIALGSSREPPARNR